MNFKESLRQVKHDFRKSRIEAKGAKCLDSKCVLYFDRPVEGILELHITDGLTKQIFQEGYAKLVEIVKSDINIKNIKMVSPFTLRHQDFMEKLGFEVNNSLTDEVKAEIESGFPKNMRGKPFVEMQISREKFLQINDKTNFGTLGKKL
jgi:hypothetical protein